MHTIACRIAAFGLALAPAMAQAAPPADARAERDASGTVVLRWTSADPVDVLIADKPDQPASAARMMSAADIDGFAALPAASPTPSTQRSYFVLRNARTGETTGLGERLVPLAGGSNFRDIGGYGAADGRHVRWGLIYRSGGTALLTPQDREQIRALGLATMIDLRSAEERVLAPSRIEGVPYQAIGYSMTALKFDGGMEGGYRQLPTALAAQLRLIFSALLRGEGPVAYNCSAGQDRTGFATAMVLSALGTPRETILADYHLSTTYRRPENEMPPISAETAANNPVAAMFAAYQTTPGQTAPGQPDQGRRPQSLKTADGTAYLSFALAEIDAQWGSVDSYLKEELHLDSAAVTRLRQLYTR